MIWIGLYLGGFLGVLGLTLCDDSWSDAGGMRWIIALIWPAVWGFYVGERLKEQLR